MKITRVVLIVILSGFVAFLCGVLGLFLVRRGSGAGNFSLMGRDDSILNTYELVLEKEIDPAGVENIVVDYGMNSNDVIFYQASGDKIVVKEYLNFVADDSLKSTVEQFGNDLIIRGKKRTNSVLTNFSFNKNGYTEIYLPKITFENLTVTTISGEAESDLSFEIADQFQVSTTSGDILFNSVKADTIQLSAVSGDVRIQEALGNVKASTTSGDLMITGGVGDSRISSVSGEIVLDGMEGSFDLSTTSGDIIVRNGKGYGRVNTVSGDVNISLSELTQDLSANTTSGEVNFRLPENASFDFEYNTTSGDCRTFFDDVLSYNKKRDHAKGTYGNSASQQVSVSTVSGDLSITKY
ncbi:MAG TPA: DUF4097 family beta strand repeat-containing protein [Lachnospiraceae bacterium]|nr:DUF4097 family beta strand repeat-containing protein [Lachnospiraceae bacterium]